MLIWFVHAPRTGGMSLAHYLGTIKGNGLKIRHQGHEKMCLGVLDILKEHHGKVIVCTIIRDPAKHSMSLWTYAQKHHEHHDHQNAMNLTFSEWCKTNKEFPYYVKFYGKGDPVLAEKVLNHIDYVFNTETLVEDVNKMLVDLGLKPNFNIHRNGTSKRLPSDIEIALNKSVRKADYDLLKKTGLWDFID